MLDEKKNYYFLLFLSFLHPNKHPHLSCKQNHSQTNTKQTPRKNPTQTTQQTKHQPTFFLLNSSPFFPLSFLFPFLSSHSFSFPLTENYTHMYTFTTLPELT